MPSVASIRELPYFSRLSQAQISDLEAGMRRRELPPQQATVREGGPGHARSSARIRT
jgi:hypothetical protein